MKANKIAIIVLIIGALIMVLSSFFSWLAIPGFSEAALDLSINTGSLIIKRASVGIMGMAAVFIGRKLYDDRSVSAVVKHKYIVLLLACAGASLFIVLTGTVTEDYIALGYRNGMGFVLALAGSLCLAIAATFLFMMNRKKDGRTGK